MPIHDWSRVNSGIFHAFHQMWITEITRQLNSGLLPRDYYALPEQVTGGMIPDVVTLQAESQSPAGSDSSGGTAVASAPPKTAVIRQAEDELYALRADRIVVRHSLGDVVAVIEIVSPGNKQTRSALRAFVEKSVRLLRQGIHLLIVDLLPPMKHDPAGIHKAIWDEIVDEPFELPADQQQTLVAYAAGTPKIAYIQPTGVGEALPDMPVFLSAERYVNVPLENSYQATWSTCPAPMKRLLET